MPQEAGLLNARTAGGWGVARSAVVRLWRPVQRHLFQRPMTFFILTRPAVLSSSLPQDQQEGLGAELAGLLQPPPPPSGGAGAGAAGGGDNDMLYDPEFM